MALAWYIDGINLKEYGITVSGSIGLVDGLQMKSPFKVDLPDYHGEIVDLENTRYEPRDITLNCWIKAFGMLDFTIKVNTFIQSIKGNETHRFMIEIDPKKPLVYEVYFPDKTAINKTWNDSTMIGTFSIKMRESEPIKKILSFITPKQDFRNYVRGSKELKHGGSLNAFTFLKLNLSEGLQPNTEYVLSIGKSEILSGTAVSSFTVLVYNVSTNKGANNIVFPISTDKKSVTFKTGVLPNNGYTLLLYTGIGGSSQNRAMKWTEVQLEKSNKAGDWNPAPEDVQNGATLNISTDKLVNIHWGDGSHDYDIFGDNIALKHLYTEEGVYFIIISGVIEEIKSISTNASVIWNII